MLRKAILRQSGYVTTAIPSARLGGAWLQRKMASSNIAAIVQLTCTADKEENFRRAKSWIERAKHERNASVVFLPEGFDYIGESAKQTRALAEPLDGRLISKYKELAKRLNVGLSLGGLHEAYGKSADSKLRVTHVFITSDGEVSATYSKLHLFNVEIPDRGVRLRESDYVVGGSRIVAPVTSAVGKIGLGICYDVRFPEMSISLAKMGADILTYPSAFTVPTGLAHWESLLRSQAILNQCYVVAAAQTGKHNQKRSSYGHSMIVDPWGRVVAQCSEGEGVASAAIDLGYVSKVRQEMPVFQHRRSDLYGLSCADAVRCGSNAPDCHDFATVRVPRENVVLESQLSYVCVNRKPVVPCHLLAIPIRKTAVRLQDLSCEETSDLFNLVRKAQLLVENARDATSSTVAVQDGPDAGQTMNHLHVHVLARKKEDFDDSDDVYGRLEMHDKGHEGSVGLRSQQEMAREAEFLREKASEIFSG